jgi:hypothetical protein
VSELAAMLPIVSTIDWVEVARGVFVGAGAQTLFGADREEIGFEKP